LIFAPTEEEHAVDMLTPWEKELEMLEDMLNHHSSQGSQQMMTIVSRSAVEDEEKFQPGEQLEKARVEPAQGELATTKLSQEEAEKKLNDKSTKLNFAAQWQVNTTIDGENHKGGRVDLPIDKEEVQSMRLHKENQKLEQLDEVIDNIRRLMLRSVQEAVNKEKLSRKKPAITAGKKQQQQ